MSRGGTIRFGCAGTIYLTNGLVVARDAVLDASDRDPIQLFNGSGKRTLQVNAGVTLTLINLNLDDGKDVRGGAILNFGHVKLVDCSFFRNEAVAGPDEAAAGGAIWNGSGAVIEATNCTFDSSSSYGGTALGGAIYNEGSLAMVNCTFFGNVISLRDDAPSGSGWGGGIFNTNGTVTAIHCTFSQNGGLSFCGSNCGGGAIANLGSGTVTVRNCILANSRHSGNGLGTLIDDGNNISSDGTCNFSATGSFNDTDPKLGGLLAIGGPTKTMPLLPGSPAVDAGNPAFCPATDQRGVARPGGAGCDIGAFEGVLPHPIVSQRFSPEILSELGTATLIFTLSNPAPIFLTISFTNDLPAQLTVFQVPTPFTTCGSGGLRTALGTSNFELHDVAVPPGYSCTVGIVVTSSVPGLWTNPAVQGYSAEAGAGLFSNPATLAVSGKPVAVSGPVSDRTPNSARLHATINPSGSATAVHFEYGATGDLGKATAAQTVSGGFSEQTVSADILGLSGNGTYYYYRAAASNLHGAAYGAVQTFALAGTTRITRLAEGTVALDCLTWPGRTNLLQTSSNLVDWTTAGVLTGTNELRHLEQSTTVSPAQFFRLWFPE